ncbi:MULTISPECIES: hypothetical protein [Pseudomonas syringae group]|nr:MULTISPECIES: hypothetical protein [Pseudomonas syringae group]MDH4602479.1 hypothetical protein [Pseudomonas syringae pv. papulans]
MKHNEHVMTWLASLSDEAKRPDCHLRRIIEIAGTLARYGFGTGSV